MRRTVPAFVAMLSLVALAAGPRPIPVSQLNPAITISVDAALNRHAIDDRIYGVSFGDQATLTDLDIKINRWGGNGTSRYNWAISTSNHARDWFFENIPDPAPLGGANGESADLFIQPTLAAVAQPIMTIPMLTLLPNVRDYGCGYSVMKYGPTISCCDAIDSPFHSDCGNGFHNGVALKTFNDPLDVAALYPATHQANWVQHNVDTFGPASTTGVKYYALDNEPGLWDSTHFDVHPDYATYDELWTKTQTYGALIKARDPSALVSGIEEWGYLGYFFSSSDWNQHSTADKDAHGGLYHVDYLLTQARNYEQTQGIRVFDIASLHIYPQGDRFGDNEYRPWDSVEETQIATKLLRNRSTRSLWDPAYVDESWIPDIGIDSGIVRLIPRLRDWVNKDYPGTKIGITEYNWGPDAQANDNDMSGATAQADILGIFGREGLDLGVRWTSPRAGSTAYNAFKMYRNYDGLHSKFGDLSVSAVSPDPDNVAAFAALRSTDRKLTIMIVGKDFTNTTPVTVNVANFAPSGSAELRQLTSTNTFAAPTTVALGAGPSYAINVPPSTIMMLIVPGSYLDAPTGVAATATSTASVGIQWNPVAGANNYHVLRALTLSGGFTEFATTSSLSATDGARSANTTYLYKVQASNATMMSAPSIIDPATTIMFTNDPLTAGTVVKKEHLNELRAAVAAMRFAANLAPATFTDVPINAGTADKAQHILELRTALDQARATLGLSAGVWTDPAVTATTSIRAAQITALRNSVK
jgi:hypothetical protein